MMSVAHTLQSKTTTPLQLMRRWVVDYFNAHNALAAREFITPDYTLNIGDVVFAGRDDEWLPAVAKQMKLFPSLAMTVHQAIAGDDWAAAWFSEHGASEGRAACWSGVAIYRSNGAQLTSCIAQEDYFTRHRQMKSGVSDPVEPPAVAPWDMPQLPPDAAAEAAVRQWLRHSWPPAQKDVRCDDEHITGVPLVFDVQSSDFGILHSSGSDVVFHVRQTGTYVGGLAGLEPQQSGAVLYCNGIVRVVDGQVQHGRVIRDRVGLRASLKKAGAKP
jgi:hypothetical protein